MRRQTYSLELRFDPVTGRPPVLLKLKKFGRFRLFALWRFKRYTRATIETIEETHLVRRYLLSLGRGAYFVYLIDGAIWTIESINLKPLLGSKDANK